MAHKPTLYRGQSTVPAGIERPGQVDFPLRLVTTRGGRAFDPTSLEFVIIEDPDGSPVQVFPVAGRQAVNLSNFPDGDRLGVGVHIARWTVPVDATIIEHEIQWFVKQSATDAEKQVDFRFLLADYSSADREAEILALSTGLYCTEQDVREEGYQDSARFRKARIDRLIAGASRDIERWTGRWFEPRPLSFLTDGSGSKMLEMPGPVIEIKEVRVLTGSGAVESEVIDLQDIVAYNRWLQGITNPDDRYDPRIAIVAAGTRTVTQNGLFPRGDQNIQVTGIFGYTDRNPTVSPYGSTPERIRRCCVLLVARELPEIRDYHAREDRQRRHLLTSEKADDQTFQYRKHPRPAMITGDPEIDAILVDYRRRPQIESTGGIHRQEFREPLGGVHILSMPGMGAC